MAKECVDLWINEGQIHPAVCWRTQINVTAQNQPNFFLATLIHFVQMLHQIHPMKFIPFRRNENPRPFQARVHRFTEYDVQLVKVDSPRIYTGACAEDIVQFIFAVGIWERLYDLDTFSKFQNRLEKSASYGISCWESLASRWTLWTSPQNVEYGSRVISPLAINPTTSTITEPTLKRNVFSVNAFQKSRKQLLCYQRSESINFIRS